MHLFYTTDIAENRATLSAEESAHCIRVMRMRKGELVNIIDGKGNLIEGIIEDPDPSKCRVAITSLLHMPHPRKSKLHIAIAPTKSIDRFEWFVEKSVEIGIDVITPLLCQRSERRTLKTDRIEKLVISTMKQAKIYHKPVLHQLTDYKKLLASIDTGVKNRFIADCDERKNMLFGQSYQLFTETIVLIGPEGDFTAEEIKLSQNMKFQSVSLGTTRLRTETAGIVACNLLNSIDLTLTK